MKSEIKRIRHQFTPDEIAAKNIEYRQANRKAAAVAMEFDSVKARYKAMVSEAEARASGLDALIEGGFEMRDEKCVVIYDVAEKLKHYHLETALVKGELPKDSVPAHTEPMTDEDLQISLVDAEAQFENVENIALFIPAIGSGDTVDSGLLSVGRFRDKWYSSLRVNIGKNQLQERLNPESKAFKNRIDAIKTTIKRFRAWLVESVGKESAAGFDTALDEVIETHKERAE